MQPKFELGEILIKPEAAYVLKKSGQEATFFLDKHVRKDWGTVNAELNEQRLKAGKMVASSYRTLLGHNIVIITNFEEKKTAVLCLNPPEPEPGSVSLVDYLYWGYVGKDI